MFWVFFFFQAEDGIRDYKVTGVQTCALPISWCCDPIPSPPLRNTMAMDMKQLEEKVKDIIVEELGVERDKLTSDASFMEDLGADSLDTVELVMAFEKEFDIDIPDEEAEKLRTVGQALQYLHEKMGK